MSLAALRLNGMMYQAGMPTYYSTSRIDYGCRPVDAPISAPFNPAFEGGAGLLAASLGYMTSGMPPVGGGGGAASRGLARRRGQADRSQRRALGSPLADAGLVDEEGEERRRLLRQRVLATLRGVIEMMDGDDEVEGGGGGRGGSSDGGGSEPPLQ
jgi:hypothetical protein